MENLIQQFFILYKKVSIPGLGTFGIEREIAFHDFTNSLINPARERIHFSEDCNVVLEEKFLQFARQHANTSKAEVETYFQSLRNNFNKTGRLQFDGLGILERKDAAVHFEPLDFGETYLPPLEVNRIIHNDAVHEIKVGENIKTNTEMREMLSEKKSKDYWWVYALLLLLAATGAIVYYLYGPK